MRNQAQSDAIGRNRAQSGAPEDDDEEEDGEEKQLKSRDAQRGEEHIHLGDDREVLEHLEEDEQRNHGVQVLYLLGPSAPPVQRHAIGGHQWASSALIKGNHQRPTVHLLQLPHERHDVHILLLSRARL